MTNFNEPWRDGEPDDVSEMLNDLPEVAPPSTLVSDVMATIAARAKTHQPPATLRMRGGIMAKKVLWIVAAAAAIALVALRLAGYPPVDKGTEATIGAAQRYQAPQISNADVKTEDADLQAFLQSDLFQQLTNDPQAQQALRNEDFRRALADANVRAALASSDIRAAIADISRNAAADSRINAARQAAADATVSASRQASLDAAMKASDALRAALAVPHVADAIARSSLGAVLATPRAALALSNNARIDAVLRAAEASLAATKKVSPDAVGAQRKEAATDAAPRK
jgi:hypothetical protein